MVDPCLVVVTGWTGAGKSTMSDLIAADTGATVASFDWVMSGLRSLPEVWAHVDSSPERQRQVGWNLLARIAEQQLRRGSSCVLDLVAREEPVAEWRALAARYRAVFGVVECRCSDIELHRTRVVGRQRAIPGWYELEWERVLRGRTLYEPLAGSKVVIDAVDTVENNHRRVSDYLAQLTPQTL